MTSPVNVNVPVNVNEPVNVNGLEKPFTGAFTGAFTGEAGLELRLGQR